MTAAVIATAGHVDHGKSTLVQALTGTDPDRLPEEKRRGLTLDLGFAWIRIGGADLSFVDVPGHERFVATTLAGVGPASGVLLVVSADEGWRPQTHEHAAAVVALGLTHLVVAVTRTDLADPGPCLAQTHQHLGALGLAAQAVVPVSARTGAGLAGLGASLVDLATALPTADPSAPVRLWVDRAFTIAGAGTVVTGTLAAGTVRSADVLRHRGHPVTVRAVQTHGEPLPQVCAPARVAVNLRGVPPGGIGRGDALTTPAYAPEVAAVDILPREPVARLPRQLMLHVGTAALSVHAWRRPDGLVRLRLQGGRTAPLLLQDPVCLRDPGSRAGLIGGTIAALDPPRRPSRQAAADPSADSARQPDGDLEALAGWLAAHPLSAPSAEVVSRWRLSGRDLAEAQAAGRVVRLDGLLLHPSCLTGAPAALRGLHDGFSLGEAARALGTSRRVALAVLSRLDATGTTRRHADGTRTLSLRP